MDSTPFYVFDILSFTERDVEALRPLCKASFNPAAVQTHAEDLIYVAEITRHVNALLRNFVRFLVKEAQLAPSGVTQKVLDRFIPIVKRAIQTTIVELMASSIQQELAQAQRAATGPSFGSCGRTSTGSATSQGGYRDNRGRASNVRVDPHRLLGVAD